MRAPRWSLGALALSACLLALPGRSDAADQDTAAARAHFKAAEAHFSLGEFSSALDEYRKAYLLRPLPPLLFNMAQCHRQLGDLDKAAFLLRRFLASSPTAEQRAQAEAVLQDVELALKARAAAARSRPAASAPPRAAPASAPRPLAATRPVSVAALSSGPPLVPSKRPVTTPAPPLYRRWWLWAIVGGVVVAATATTVGVLATRGELPQGSLPSIDYR